MNSEDIDIDIDTMITTFNTAVTETDSEILGKHRQKKKKLGHCRNKVLICATKGEIKERKDSNLKDLRNTKK